MPLPAPITTTALRANSFSDGMRFNLASSSSQYSISNASWHDKALNDVEFALHCYAQALAALPGYPMALHNVYAVLVLAARFDEADRSLASVAPDAAAQIRGAHLGLLHPNVEPACRGAVFSDREGVSPA